MTVRTAVDGRDVEEDDEEGEEAARSDETHANADDLAATIELVEVNERQKREGEEEPEEEAEQVRVVVDVRKQAHREENKQEAELLEQRATRMTQQFPVLNELSEQTSDDAELRACRPGLERESAAHRRNVTKSSVFIMRTST